MFIPTKWELTMLGLASCVDSGIGYVFRRTLHISAGVVF